MTTTRRTNENGQAMVEFALVMPLFALLLFGVIQLGIVFHDNIALTDAVRAGARTAAVSRFTASPASNAEAAVRRSASTLDGTKLTVSVSAPSGWTRGSDVTVSATYPYDVNLLGIVVRSGRLTSSTTERVE